MEGISLSILSIGILFVFRTYYTHIKLLYDDSIHEEVKGHVRQHLYMFNIFLIFIITFLYLIWEVRKFHLEGLLIHTINLGLMSLGAFLVLAAIHLKEELRENKKWSS